MTGVRITWHDRRFVKSSYSRDEGECVEVVADGHIVGVRDSKLGPSSPVLELTATAFAAFLADLKAS